MGLPRTFSIQDVYYWPMAKSAEYQLRILRSEKACFQFPPLHYKYSVSKRHHAYLPVQATEHKP